MNASVCQYVRGKCSQNVDTESGCQDFKSCARKNTPPVFNSVCHYYWDESAAGGSCQPGNSITERVSLACPGSNTKLTKAPPKVAPLYGRYDWDRKAFRKYLRDAGQYSDRAFSCSAQRERFKEEYQNCAFARRYYYQGCPTQPSQPAFAVSSCDDLPEAVSEVSERIEKADENFSLAMKAYAGDGEDQDYRKAAHYLTEALKYGSISAEYWMGKLYYEGWGVKRDDKLALKYYAKSAANGVLAGINGLGVLYYQGRGVRENKVAAYAWFYMAAERDYTKGTDNLRIVKKELGEEEIAEGDAMAASCKSDFYEGCALSAALEGNAE